MRSDFKDYYKILGVSKNATSDEINRAFRKLSRKYHPDISKEENAEEVYKIINEAYEVLGDEEKRREYDFIYHDYLNYFNSDFRDEKERVILKVQIVKILKVCDFLNKEYEIIMNNNTGEDIKKNIENLNECLAFINKKIKFLIENLSSNNLTQEKSLLIEKYRYNIECINNLKVKLLERYNDLILCYIDQIDYFILSVNSNSYEKITKLKVEIDDFVMELNDVNAFDIQDNLIKLKQRITLLDNLLLTIDDRKKDNTKFKILHL